MARKDTGPEAVVARGADVPLALSQTGPRDALLDPREGDIIPDLENKGLHVGEVAQPAEPVLHRNGDVTFESLPEAPASRFTADSFAEQKRKNSEMQASDPAYAGRTFVGDEDPATATYREPATRPSGTQRPATRTAPASSAASDLDDDSAKVASAQAAEDRK